MRATYHLSPVGVALGLACAIVSNMLSCMRMGLFAYRQTMQAKSQTQICLSLKGDTSTPPRMASIKSMSIGTDNLEGIT